ncbi:hypothetical protein GF345_06535 [Candidatus Woesearchaeota archaeon]|nr:hypothetical protein [Candidatus Woesearchaeota archaeon]
MTKKKRTKSQGKKGSKGSESKKQIKDQTKDKNGQDEDLSSDKKLIFAILAIFAVFLVFALVLWQMGKEPEIKTVQQLHEENLEGDLDPDEGYIYKGYSFVNVKGMWFTQVQRYGTNDLYNVQFHFGPRDIEDIPVEGNINEFKEINATYVAFDPTADDETYTTLAAGELSINIATVFNMMPVAACVKNVSETCHTRPIINCSTSERPVIYLENSDTPAVVRDNACIRVQGDGEGLVKAVDRLLLSWFGIMV